ncbi:MAG: hypothetical protein O3A82_02175 [Verrucomicrobia bacterium]|jgi:hypothetical protein|nr:hypothetical protein [Verrucomicrobiota bacterium]MDA1045716.1 hypothetical protein [Verrucomicrobiota bacterium]
MRYDVMHKHTLPLLLAGLLAISCTEKAVPPRAGEASDLKQSLPNVLVVGRWRFIISEGLPSQETKTYQFSPDGSYKFVLTSDFEYRDHGTWQLTKKNDGSFLLTLTKTRDEQGAHFLLSSSQLEYDQEADRLFVRGPNYADNAHMRHISD